MKTLLFKSNITNPSSCIRKKTLVILLVRPTRHTSVMMHISTLVSFLVLAAIAIVAEGSLRNRACESLCGASSGPSYRMRYGGSSRYVSYDPYFAPPGSRPRPMRVGRFPYSAPTRPKFGFGYYPKNTVARLPSIALTKPAFGARPVLPISQVPSVALTKPAFGVRPVGSVNRLPSVISTKPAVGYLGPVKTTKEVVIPLVHSKHTI